MRCDIKMYWKRQALKKNPLLYRRFLELQGKPIRIMSDDDTYAKDRKSVLIRDYLALAHTETNISVKHVGGHPFPIVS